jgi:1,2-diacylglycerol 3-alpha-glucosyltransferase
MVMAAKPRIALVCTGLGVVRRGFEVSTLAWARALRADRRFEVEVYSGGATTESKRLPCLTQNSAPVRLARKWGILQDGARLQQRTFAPALRRELRRSRPDFVWMQEWTLARNIQGWLRHEAIRTRLIFCNGAPVSPADCRDFDLVVDLHEAAYSASLAAGIPADRLGLMPHPCAIAPWEGSPESARARLGLRVDRWVVACVAAWNRHHKRIHVLIEAAARAGVPELHLLLCGQPEREAPGLKSMADELMPGRCTWLTLPPEQLPAVYAAADLFVLPSLTEGLGAVFIEAGGAGVPVLANRMPATESIFGRDYPGLMDMTSPSDLAIRLQREHAAPQGLRQALPRSILVSRYSPSSLAGRMHDFIAGAMAQKGETR